MVSRIGDIVIDCAQPRLLAEFWCAVLGYRWAEEDETGVAISGSPSAPCLLFIRVPEAKAAKNRLHFDVCATDRTQAEELDRLLALGARRSAITGDGRWVVLEDPEGNEFCLMARRIPAEPAPFHRDCVSLVGTPVELDGKDDRGDQRPGEGQRGDDQNE
jgi:hypothetical protein